ncbi:MAG: glycosyltransferase [Verrucomicrobia bacterium]|nr:glycosyltransferase [Verrucomicrobiota bacterium]
MTASEQKRAAVLLASHNRVGLTLKCLGAIRDAEWPPAISYKVFLVDDGSTDGTREQVSLRFPDVSVILGTGKLFWCNGMRLAWNRAASEDFDFYLWMNDDTLLCREAIGDVFRTFQAEVRSSGESVIVVGSCRDPESGGHSYGGLLRTGLNPSRLIPVIPGTSPKCCDTFTGNIVLVPRHVYQAVGGLRSYAHSLGDNDYGLRAGRAGCRIAICAGYQGSCRANYYGGRYYGLPFSSRMKRLFDRKVFPPISWLRYQLAHAGLMGLLYWARSLTAHLMRALGGGSCAAILARLSSRSTGRTS